MLSLLLTFRVEPGSDRRLDEIHYLDYVINQVSKEGILSSPPRTLSYFDQQVRLYNKSVRDGTGLANAFINAAQLAIANSDLARGYIFTERAVADGERRSAMIARKRLSTDL